NPLAQNCASVVTASTTHGGRGGVMAARASGGAGAGPSRATEPLERVAAGSWRLHLLLRECDADEALAGRVDLVLLLAVSFRLLDEFVQHVVNDPRVGDAAPDVADHALVVHHEKRRRAHEVPGAADDAQPFTVRRVGERAEVELLLVHHLLELPGIVTVDVDADQGKRPTFHRLDERPLVAPEGPSLESELAPEIQQDNLALVVGQLEVLAVLVHALDLRRRLADGQVPQVEQLAPGLPADRAIEGCLHAGILV